LKASWHAEYESWKRRRLNELEPVYMWADGIYVKAGLEKDKAAMLVVIAGLRDGRKVVRAGIASRRRVGRRCSGISRAGGCGRRGC
jgi:putative transposase